MKKSLFNLFSFMLTVLAAVFGADMSMAMAVAAGDNEPINRPADPDSKFYDPENPTDPRNLKTDLSGTPATEKTVKDSDINDDEIDNLVVRFRPFNYTLSTDIEKIARQKQVTDYTIKHPVMATPIMDCKNRKLYTAGGSDTSITLTIGASSANLLFNEARMFGKSQTFIAKGVPGYKGTTAEGDLMLKVVGRASDGVVCVPVNGYQATPSSDMVLHDDIPLNTKFQMLATAGHTAQLVVSPKNQTPVFVDANLQKKIMNTTIEKEWKAKKKNMAFFTDDIADNAMMIFRQENERTKLCGAGGMLVEDDETLGKLNCYYEEGVMPQLLMKYATTGALTYKDLVSIAKMQFGKWSASNEAEMYCSYGVIEQLLNLDFTKVAQTNVLATQSEFGVDITKFKTSFGTLNIKLCPILDEMGFEDCAIVLDMKNAVHYWKKPNVGEKSKEDLSKGGEKPVEADRDRYIKIDCFCLRGYNSILVGPTEKIYGMDTVYDNRSDIYEFYDHKSTTYYSLDPATASTGTGAQATPYYWIGSADSAAPDALVDGLLIHLNSDALTFKAGEIIRYDASISSWVKYSGIITA